VSCLGANACLVTRLRLSPSTPFWSQPGSRVSLSTRTAQLLPVALQPLEAPTLGCAGIFEAAFDLQLLLTRVYV